MYSPPLTRRVFQDGLMVPTAAIRDVGSMSRLEITAESTCLCNMTDVVDQCCSYTANCNLLAGMPPTIRAKPPSPVCQGLRRLCSTTAHACFRDDHAQSGLSELIESGGPWCFRHGGVELGVDEERLGTYCGRFVRSRPCHAPSFKDHILARAVFGTQQQSSAHNSSLWHTTQLAPGTKDVCFE
jgi:guanyl-specific ribonuclease Sa